MDDREMRRHLAQYGDGCGLIVDEYAALAGSGNLAADNQRAVFRFIQSVALEHLFYGFPGNACALKYRRDHCALGASANYFTRRFIAQQQGQGIDQNGFASARFSGEQVDRKSTRLNSSHLVISYA